MSERSFARRFAQTTGDTPLQWLLTQRVLAAQHLLEVSDLPIAAIARRCGFSTPLTMRHHPATSACRPATTAWPSASNLKLNGTGRRGSRSWRCWSTLISPRTSSCWCSGLRARHTKGIRAVVIRMDWRPR
ncbi:helix-turn-helix domain-containing protein [Microtetraspora malaysiensis]|uniref:helix-turn-helix domain-containing protein n=1 Tax=Microtetraspora malaysiensis TaxID=161358 RepID=UPI003D918C32